MDFIFSLTFLKSFQKVEKEIKWTFGMVLNVVLVCCWEKKTFEWKFNNRKATSKYDKRENSENFYKNIIQVNGYKFEETWIFELFKIFLQLFCSFLWDLKFKSKICNSRYSYFSILWIETRTFQEVFEVKNKGKFYFSSWMDKVKKKFVINSLHWSN